MKTANLKLLTGRHALMLAVAMAPFAAAGQAQAACSPLTSQANPVYDATITCDTHHRAEWYQRLRQWRRDQYHDQRWPVS
jgi:hypothetical protein